MLNVYESENCVTFEKRLIILSFITKTLQIMKEKLAQFTSLKGFAAIILLGLV